MWTYLTYFQFLKRYKWQVAAYAVALGGFVIFENLQPYFYKLLVDRVCEAKYEGLGLVVGGYVAFRLLAAVVGNVEMWLSDWVIFRVSRDIRLSVFERIQKLDFAYHTSKSTGSMISAIKRGDGALFELDHNLAEIVEVVLSFVVMSLILLRLGPGVALIILASLMISLVVAGYLIGYNVKVRRMFNTADDKLSDIITDNLINYETVKLFAREDKEVGRLKDNYGEWLRKGTAYGNSFRFIDLSMSLITNGAVVVVLMVGLDRLMNGILTVGDYVMVLGFISSFYPKFYDVVWNIRSLAKHQVDLDKYMAILKEEIQVKDPYQPKTINEVKGEIEFRNVSFSYPEGKKGAVNSIDLTIKPGQSVALVGHSGVGKTTLIKLLMRFFDPQEGEILLDGIDIRKLKKQTLRSFMGVVPQEPVLFNQSIGYNIGYGADDPTEKDIRAAAKMANLDEFISGLPLGYETMVGERGVKLSGGQKQRLAIARMILANPDIVIFDEATSQLDSESEKLIQDAFWKATKNKTTIVIAHRLSTIVRAEKIVVMESGTIKEVGSHRQLLARKNTLYSHFWKLQTGRK